MPESFPWREAPKADFAVIGDPVAHSLSPRMHQAAYEELGLPYRYVAIQVPPHEVGMALDHLDGLGYQGVNVTVPHKEEILLWVDSVEPFAGKVRAANTLLLPAKQAVNTDGPGFLDTLTELEILPPSKVLLLGAGGSARALLLALFDAGYSIEVWNRTHTRAQIMLEGLGIEVPTLDDLVLTDHALVVNATASGIGGPPLPIDWSQAQKGAVAYDLYYSVEPTEFLKGASAHGLKCVDGKPLLVAQGARSFEWWLDMAAPREAMMKAIR